MERKRYVHLRHMVETALNDLFADVKADRYSGIAFRRGRNSTLEWNGKYADRLETAFGIRVIHEPQTMGENIAGEFDDVLFGEYVEDENITIYKNRPYTLEHEMCHHIVNKLSEKYWLYADLTLDDEEIVVEAASYAINAISGAFNDKSIAVGNIISDLNKTRTPLRRLFNPARRVSLEFLSRNVLPEKASVNSSVVYCTGQKCSDDEWSYHCFETKKLAIPKSMNVCRFDDETDLCVSCGGQCFGGHVMKNKPNTILLT